MVPYPYSHRFLIDLSLSSIQDTRSPHDQSLIHNKNTDNKKIPEEILKKIYDELSEKELTQYCCALTDELMTDPVIDPTTLRRTANSRPTTLFTNIFDPTQYINFHDVPRYDRASLERLMDCDGKIRSPQTRKIFTSEQLISDIPLKNKIDTLLLQKKTIQTQQCEKAKRTTTCCVLQ